MKLFLLLLIFFVSLVSDGRSANPAAQPDAKRIRYDIRAVEERDGLSTVISETTIEGPPGTDFSVNLQSGKFRLDTKFLNDLIAPDLLQVRADYNTRRLYGYSESNRPLYEEDEQNKTIQLRFDEKLVLLPFGPSENSNQLKIEITPNVSDSSLYVDSGRPRPLEIKILKASPGGAIRVEAWKAPHRFAVDAVLLEDGKEVARSSSETLFGESNEIILKPTEQASTDVIDHPLALTLNVSRYMRSRPEDQIAIDFNAYEIEGPERTRRSLGYEGAGINELGAALNYDVSAYYLKSLGRKYELRFRIKLAPGEAAN